MLFLRMGWAKYKASLGRRDMVKKKPRYNSE